MDNQLDLGALGFWLFLATVVGSSIIAGAIKEKSLHRLIERSIEKSGTIDPRLADLLEKEIQRKADNDARMWGPPDPASGASFRSFLQKAVSSVIAAIGALFGFLAFLGLFIRASRGGGPPEGEVQPFVLLLIAVGIGGAIAGLFGLVAWLIWPKTKKPKQSEPSP